MLESGVASTLDELDFSLRVEESKALKSLVSKQDVFAGLSVLL